MCIKTWRWYRKILKFVYTYIRTPVRNGDTSFTHIVQSMFIVMIQYYDMYSTMFTVVSYLKFRGEMCRIVK